MKLIWKGKFHSEEQLKIGNLPENAVKFKEPETPAKLSMVASLFIIPVIFIVGITFFIKDKMGISETLYNFSILGMLLSYLVIIPHEFLHAIAFPVEAEVEIWYSFKHMMAFVFSTHPTSKWRFIFLSLLPNIVFGFIPLVAWIFMPQSLGAITDITINFAIFSLMMGCGDFLNVFNALTQMPKNSITQLSGFHSYWYMKEQGEIE